MTDGRTDGRTLVLLGAGRAYVCVCVWLAGCLWLSPHDSERAHATPQGLVELETVDTEEEAALLKAYIEEHVHMTGSTVGQRVRGC